MYNVEIVPEALEELQRVPVFHRRALEALIETKLHREPMRSSKNCKKLEPLVTGFQHEPPLWELRAGDWRIFYDVDHEESIVVIRAVRLKPKGKTTGDIV